MGAPGSGASTEGKSIDASLVSHVFRSLAGASQQVTAEAAVKLLEAAHPNQARLTVVKQHIKATKATSFDGGAFAALVKLFLKPLASVYGDPLTAASLVFKVEHHMRRVVRSERLAAVQRAPSLHHRRESRRGLRHEVGSDGGSMHGSMHSTVSESAQGMARVLSTAKSMRHAQRQPQGSKARRGRLHCAAHAHAQKESTALRVRAVRCTSARSCPSPHLNPQH